jgi:Domain of unknown function (DUF1844)
VAEPKQEDTFRVVDRRLFTADGELRKDAVEQERRDEEAARKVAGKGTNAAAPGSSATPTTARDAPGAPQAAAQVNQPSREFQMLVDFLTRNAAAMLGGVADPRTGQAYLDLEGSRELIDMLDALREKTQGNLAKADEDLLVEVIGSLKLTYMEVSKVAAEAMSKKAKQKG